MSLCSAPLRGSALPLLCRSCDGLAVGSQADRIDVCGRVPQFVEDELTSLGYEVRRWDAPAAFSRPQGIEVAPSGDTQGGSCMSGDGMALKVLAGGRIVTGSLPLARGPAL